MTHDELKKNLSAEIGDTRKGYCSEQDKETLQTCVEIDPYNENLNVAGVIVWQCNECFKIIEVERLIIQIKRDKKNG